MNRIDVTHWVVEGDEPRGEDPKLWLQEPASSASSPALWLFKTTKAGRNQCGGYRRHDDFAEYVVYKIGSLLGIPCAEAQLAIHDGQEGIISRNAGRGSDFQIHSGNMTLIGMPGYDAEAHKMCQRVRPGHNLTNIGAVLSGLKGPHLSECHDWSAFDVFSGYLMLDALVANNDRHAENWAVEQAPLSPAVEPDRLVRSFDHGSALASGVDDDACERKLGNIKGFCDHGKAKRFENRNQPLVDIALEALSLATPRAATWTQRLAATADDDLSAICHSLAVSEPRAMLMSSILRENKRRILR